MSNKREKKAERREAKAARKAANAVEQKKTRPNNGLLAIGIFGVLILMFVFIWGYNFYQKEESIQSYMKNNGGSAAYENLYFDEYSTMDVTAKDNDMKVVLKVKSDDKSIIKSAKKYYKSKAGKKQVKYFAAYYLTTIKPETRAITASATYSVKINKEVLFTKTVKYRESKKFVEEYTEEMTGGSEE